MNVRMPIFGSSGNPLAQALSVIVFGVLLVAAVVMGAVLLAAVIGVAVIAWIVFTARLWWLGRKARGAAGGRTQPDAAAPAGRLIEGEYTVLGERESRRGPRDDESR